MNEVRSSSAGVISPSDFLRDSRIGREARPFGNLPKRRYYLVVCEGEETEPNYFKSLASRLPRGMVDHVVVRGVGMNTLSLVKAAQEEIAKRRAARLPPYYHIWLVFDRDSFPAHRFDATIQAVAAIDKKNAKSKPPEHWHCAWSNEAFELWYVLHFRNQLGGAVSRAAFQCMIEEDVRRHTGETGYRYMKNDPGMFDRLMPYTLTAISRSQRALLVQKKAHGTKWSKMNPSTRVHELVRALLAYLPQKPGRRGQRSS